MKRIEFESENTTIISTLYNDLNNNPIIIILTGDSPKGSKSDTWPSLIEILIKANLCVYIFDFHSQGFSMGERKDLTLSRGIKNLKNAIANLERTIDLGERKKFALGSSFGASVLLNSPKLLPLFDGIIFKSPALLLYEAYENEIGGFDNLTEWKKKNESEINGLAYNAYVDSFHYNPYQNAFLLKCPTLIVHGGDDEIVPLNQSKRLYSLLGSASEIKILKGVRHDYKQLNASREFNILVKEFIEQIS